MEDKPAKRSVFPFYLKPGPNAEYLQWVGKYLQERRGKKTILQVARALKLDIEMIERLEQGVFHINLGQLRQILRKGYGCKLEDILSKCYEAFRGQFDPNRNRRFSRDYHYSVRAFWRTDQRKKKPTPMLIGGDPENFLWAVPLRKLKEQPLVTELLELAPSKKRKTSGVTDENYHDGIEVAYVIHGSVSVSIDGGSDGPYNVELTREDLIHFNSGYTHQIRNDGNTTSALLLIVRYPIVAQKA